MATDAEKWVESCSTCAVNGKPEKPTPMLRAFAPKAVWEAIAVDFNGPYARFGGVYILVVVDCRSRYLFAVPVKSTSLERTRDVLEAIFQREGFPKYIKSDNGPPLQQCRVQGLLRPEGYQTDIFYSVIPPAKRLGRESDESCQQRHDKCINQRNRIR
uniref:Uncharacterized protein K02A2.6 n=1 Tax=Culex pipiens TaxID=7175 RepID=A0A8D8NW36_CULPI